MVNQKHVISARDTGESRLSGIQTSPLDGKPTLILSQPVKNKKGAIESVLISELRISLIENLRRNIHFGERGHSAIVDQNGRVIAHPNPDWMKSMRDLSHLPVVKAMMAGKTGVTEFYSPFVKQNMVAGYTAVPGIGWGIMVPQPKSEVARQVYSRSTKLCIALKSMAAIVLSSWTKPDTRSKTPGEIHCRSGRCQCTAA